MSQIAVDDVQIGSADAAGFYVQAQLTRSGAGAFDLLQPKPIHTFMQNHRAHYIPSGFLL
tara:strand:+ start:3299 stop:3478 length:180 start_codon:yes stop_codon:yes gene_type:complete